MQKEKVSSLTVFCEHCDVKDSTNTLKNIARIVNYATQNHLTFIKPVQLFDLFAHKMPIDDYILLTFDDGQEYKHNNIISDCLRANDIQAISFLIPLAANFRGLYVDFDYYLQNSDVFAIGSHTLTHTMSLTSLQPDGIAETKNSPKLNYHGDKDLNASYCYGLLKKTYNRVHNRMETDQEYIHRVYTEISFSKEWIERATGKACNFFAYPWGIFNAGTVQMVKNADYKFAFSVNVSDKTKFTIPRIYPNDIPKQKRLVTINNINVIANISAYQSPLDKKYGLWK